MAPRHEVQKRRKRWLWALLVPGLVVVLASFAVLWVQSSAGERFVQSKVLEAVRDALAGRVELGGLRLDGNQLHLENLRLYTPEGELVAELATLDATVRLLDLPRRRVTIERARLSGLRGHLLQDERGLNLERAVRAKRASTPGGTVDWFVSMKDVLLENGAIDLRSGETYFALESLEVKAWADLALASMGVTGALELKAHLAAPLSAPVTLKLEADSTKGPTSATAELLVADSQLKARGSLGTKELFVDELVLAHGTMRGLMAAWPLKVPLHGKASADPSHLLASLSAGTASLETSATFTLTPLRVEVFELAAKEVDLAELVGAPRPSRLELTAKGSLADATTEQLTGSLVVDAKWTTPQQARLLTLKAHAEAKAGKVRLTPLALRTPGAELEVTGAASFSRLDLSGRLSAKDLSQLPATARSFAGVELPPLGGTGALEVEVRGATTHPSVKAVGQLSTLRVAMVAAERLDVDLDLPDVMHPLDTDARLHARRVAVGDRAFDEVTLNVGTRGRELDVDLATKGLGDLKVRAVGTLDADSMGVVLSALQLTSTSASWNLEAPAHVGWVARHLDVEPISLRDGAQRLVFHGRQRGTRASGELHAENVDLSKLPHVIAPESLGLSGVFSLDVVADGALPRPDAELTFAWTRGGILGVTDLDVRTHAKWKRETLVGTMTASAAQGSASADFDLPALAVLENRPEPLSASLKVTGVEVSRLEPLFRRSLPVSGVVSLDVVVGGTGEHPKLDATLAADSLDVRAGERVLVVGTLRLALRTREDDTLEATLSGRLFDGSVSVTVGSPFTIASLRKRVPTTKALESTAFSVKVHAQDVEVKALDAQGFVDAEGLAGKAGLEGDVSGSWLSPTGTLTVSLANGAVPPLKKVDASLTLTAGAQQTSLAVSGRLSGKPVLEARADLAANVRELATPEALGDRRASGQVSVLPFELKQLFDAEEGEMAPTGNLSGTLTFAGTLDAPALRLHATVEALKFDKAALGAARLDVTGDGAQQRVSLKLDGVGDLTVSGTLALPLTLARVTDLRAWQTSPLLLTMVSKDLDLGFLSGAHPLVRLVGGRLAMTGDVTGTLEAPRFIGDARWRNGRLALYGFGDYREVQLEVHATNDLVDLKQLELKAGAGGASLKGRLEKKGRGLYRLTGVGSTEKLPIVSDDQLVATTSLKLRLEGDVTPTLIDLTSIDLPRVDVDLPDVKRKDLQGLARPKDIIVLRGGASASRRKLREARAAAAAADDSGRGFRAVLNAPRNIWVRSSDLNVELGLSESFRVEHRGSTQIFGEATVLRGKVEVIGREFTVQKGATVRFAGPPLEPYVNVAALYTNEKEQVKVTVTAIGRGTAVSLKATSEPPLPESDIYTLLATGRRELRRGSGASMTATDAASVIGQYMTSQVKTMLAKQLPIDVLNFEASDDFNKLKVDVGKYLSDSLYLGMSAQTGANTARGENPWAARLEYQLSRSWSLEVYAGTAPAAGADVMWSRDF